MEYKFSVVLSFSSKHPSAIGTILFGHFEKHTSKCRKIVKPLVCILITAPISLAIGKIWAFAFLGIVFLAVLYVHAVWFRPKVSMGGQVSLKINTMH